MRDGIVEALRPPIGRASVSRTRGQSTFGGSSCSGRGAVSARGGRSPTSTRPAQNAISLFTPSYGLTTPAQAGVTEVVIQPFPPATANTDLVGPVVQFSGVGGSTIPRDGAVLVARGTAAERLAAEAPVGSFVTLRMILRPDWVGSPQRGRRRSCDRSKRRPVFRANEAFSAYQLGPRHPRTAVGQLADGRVIMVVVDGRRPSSVGMTNFELAQALVRLGAASASGFDGGGSSTLAFNGSLSRPSDPGGERVGLEFAPASCTTASTSTAPEPFISPNGDGVAEKQRKLSYKVVRPSTVTATLVGPGNVTAFTETIAREPGTYPVAFPPAPLDPTLPAGPPAEGRWRLDVSATDDLGLTSKTSQSFAVNSTLGFAKLSRRSLVVRAGGKQIIQAGVTLTRPARVFATVETVSGVRVASIALRRLPAGRFIARWKGTTLGGRSFVYGGLYRIRFRATNAIGVAELTTQAFRDSRGAPADEEEAGHIAPVESGLVPVASILSEITDLLTTVVGDYGLYAVFLLMAIDAVLLRPVSS